MIEWNFFKLITNYLYSKITDQFSTKQFENNEIYNQTNLVFLSALIDSFNVHIDEISSPIRFKLFITYFLNLNAKFIQLGNEDTLNEIVKMLYNDFMIKTIPIDLLTKFKNIACKKICSMLINNNIDKYKEAFSQLLENQLIDPTEYLESNDYSNETMYEELSGLTRQYLLSKSSSLILELAQHFDFKSDQDETALIEYFKMYKKKRACSPTSSQLDETRVEHKKFKASNASKKVVHSDDKQSPNASSSKENQSPLQKQDKIKVSKIRISKLLTPNINNDSNKTPVKEQPNDQQEDPYDNDTFLAPVEQDEATTSKQKTPKANTPFKRRQLIKSDHLIADSILKPRSESSPAKNQSFNSSISELDFGESPSKNTRSKHSHDETNQKKPNPLLTKKKPAKAIRNISHLIENMSENSDEEEEGKESSSDDEETEEKPAKNKSKLAKLNDSMELSSDSDESDKRSFRPKTKRKERSSWSEKETVYLAVGIELYGKGQWAAILEKFNKHFNNRTSVNLKDKWRNIERSNQTSLLKKQAAVVIKRMREEK